MKIININCPAAKLKHLCTTSDTIVNFKTSFPLAVEYLSIAKGTKITYSNSNLTFTPENPKTGKKGEPFNVITPAGQIHIKEDITFYRVALTVLQGQLSLQECSEKISFKGAQNCIFDESTSGIFQVGESIKGIVSFKLENGLPPGIYDFTISEEVTFIGDGNPIINNY